MTVLTTIPAGNGVTGPTGQDVRDTINNLLFNRAFGFFASRYGAVGDGLIDDSAAIQSAIDATNAAYIVTGKPQQLFVAPGTYRLVTSLVPKSGVQMIGAGKTLTTFKPEGAQSGFVAAATTAAPLTDIGFANLTLDGSNQTGTSLQIKGFYIRFVQRLRFIQVDVKNTIGSGFGCDQLVDYLFFDCLAQGCGRGGTNPTTGYSGFGIGTGAFADEYGLVLACTAIGNANFGFFVEKQQASLGNSLGTSTTSIPVNTVPISKTWTTQAGLAINVGDTVRMQKNADATVWIQGTVTSYSGTTLKLRPEASAGSGSVASWQVFNVSIGYRARGHKMIGCTSILNQHGFGDYGVSGLILADSLAERNTVHGMRITPSFDPDLVPVAGQVDGMQCRDNGGSGVAIVGPVDRYSFNGLRSFQNGAYGMDVQANTSNLTIAGSSLHDNEQSGFNLGATFTATDLSIKNNEIFNNGRTVGSGTDKSGITLKGSTTRLRINRNDAYDNLATQVQQYALDMQAGGTHTDPRIRDNDFLGNATAAVNNAGTLASVGTGSIDRNLGFTYP